MSPEKLKKRENRKIFSSGIGRATGIRLQVTGKMARTTNLAVVLGGKAGERPGIIRKEPVSGHNYWTIVLLLPENNITK